MFLVLWEFEVKRGCEERFEKVYGPAGDWVRLFGRDSEYPGTRLLRDPEQPGIYLTLDFWKSREAYEQFMARHKHDYKKLDALGEELTRKERRIGWYEGVEG